MKKTVLVRKQGQRLIVVLGMHRSGTSAITRGLSVFGASLGDKLMPPVKDVNSKGFFEDLDINALNIRALKEINKDWFHLAPLNSLDLEQLRVKGYSLEAVQLMRRKIKDAHLFAFKDPRVAKLLPFWRDVIGQLRLDAHYLLSLRHPLSVVKSLAKRDGFAPEYSYLLWLTHVLESLRCNVDKSLVVVDYDSLMQSPKKELTRLAEAFDFDLDTDEFNDYKNNFLDADLRHSVYELNDLGLDEACPPLVREVYTTLSAVASNQMVITGPEFRRELEIWLAEFRRLKSLFNLLDKQISQITSLNQAVIEREALIVTLGQAVAERDGQIASLNQVVIEFRGHIAAMLQSTSWRITTFYRMAGHHVKRIRRAWC